MNHEEQGKKTSQVISDAAVKEVIPAKPTDLSDEDLDKVAGGSVLTGATIEPPDQHNYKGIVTLVR